VLHHKDVTKVMWYFLVQLSSLQVSGRWQVARSKQPEANSQGPDT